MPLSRTPPGSHQRSGCPDSSLGLQGNDVFFAPPASRGYYLPVVSAREGGRNLFKLLARTKANELLVGAFENVLQGDSTVLK
jgi:hypothetical protein